MAMKRRVVAGFQRWLLNPPIKLLMRLGVPLGYALLETTGRVSGKPRRNPVGNGWEGSTFWIVAEHGLEAGYVRNIQRDPHVRVRVRDGWRSRWFDGVATVLPDDDPRARQRLLSRGHPYRALNAFAVRTMGTELVTVRVDLTDSAGTPPGTG
jgi:deazaflavin-dependent oxidoreductase (nitroreductase family)